MSLIFLGLAILVTNKTFAAYAIGAGLSVLCLVLIVGLLRTITRGKSLPKISPAQTLEQVHEGLPGFSMYLCI